MTLTLLLDLDDTLLNTNLDAFIPAYFQALTEEFAPRVPPDLMLRALIAGTNRMNESEDFSRVLQDVFNAEFYPQIGISFEELEPAAENFYDHVFPTLSSLASAKPEAKTFIDWAFSKGFRIAIATDPLFPRKATYHRVRWAGFAPEQFELVSTPDNFHFTKQRPAYYAEVLGRLGWPEGPVLMVGNDLERDILPAQELGLATWHLDEGSASRSEHGTDTRGDLGSLRSWLDSIALDALIPSFKSQDSVAGILLSTPAVLRELVRGLDPSGWFYRPKPDDWGMTELICHLRDSEREIHHMQIKLFNGQDEPFIPRPDTSVWANQRDYLQEDGTSALKEFLAARGETMELLKNIPAENWSRKARHAIFGPTNFLEVVGFMADHDRMHVQQAWRTLKKQVK